MFRDKHTRHTHNDRCIAFLIHVAEMIRLASNPSFKNILILKQTKKTKKNLPKVLLIVERVDQNPEHRRGRCKRRRCCPFANEFPVRVNIHRS